MIKVTYKKLDNQISNVNITGHALYADYGKDIVCASVSSIVITTINAILNIDQESIEYKENNGILIKNIKKDEITNILINNMLNMLKELSNDYQNNIQIREEE